MYMLPQSSPEPYGKHHQPHVTDKESNAWQHHTASECQALLRFQISLTLEPLPSIISQACKHHAALTAIYN